MEIKKLNDDFMQRIVDEDAWKELSGELNWSESLLEKYKDKVDWMTISQNSQILWTISMLKKFQNRINWEILSRHADESVLTEQCIETFMDRWTWSNLTRNNIVTPELLEKYADRWDWESVIDFYRSNLFSNRTAIAFYERYKEYIPADKLQGSLLWDKIVEQRKQQFIAEILG